MWCSFPSVERKTLYGELRCHLGEVFRKLASQKESRIEEGHLMPDHVHMMISISPKYASPRSSGLSRARAPFTWPVYMGKRSAIL